MNVQLKTVYFFLMSVLTAFAYLASQYLYAGIAALTLVIFFKKPLNYIIVAIFLVSAVFGGHIFLVTEKTVYSKYAILKTPSARIYAPPDTAAESGALVIGRFVRDESRMKPFMKPVWKIDDKIDVYSLPLVTSLLEYRNKMSTYLFFLSGGKVSVAQALIFGDKQFLDETLKDRYTISGLAHLLAMSGMHTGIIIAVVLSALVLLPLKFRFAVAVMGVFIICAFGAFSITVVRASFFASIYMLCYIFDIKIDSRKFLLLVMGLFMIFSPSIISDISFLLSFGAVFGIIYMMARGMSFWKASVMTGVAATLITAPLSMYVFGTTNHLSIITTIAMTPVVYLHILLALVSLVAPHLTIDALMYVERFSNFLMKYFTEYTYFAFILKTIPLWALIVCVGSTVALLLTRFRILAVLSLLIIFYPSPKPPEMIFPDLSGPNKGFIVFKDGRNEIFYQGSLSSFKYHFLHVAAQYGVKNFDYGSIRIFSGVNNYIKVKEKGTDFADICVNERTGDCSILYVTRSNSVTKRNMLDNVTYIIYKNKLKHPRILEISETGGIKFEGGKAAFSKDENNDK